MTMKYGEEVIGRRIGIPCVVTNEDGTCGNNKYFLREGVIRRMRVTFEVEFDNGFIDCMDLEEEEGRLQLVWIRDKNNTKSVYDPSPSPLPPSSERQTPGVSAVIRMEKVKEQSSTTSVAQREAQQKVTPFGNNGGKQPKQPLFPWQTNQTREPIGSKRKEPEPAPLIDENRRRSSNDETSNAVDALITAASREDNNLKLLARPKKRQTTEAHEATLLKARNLPLERGNNKKDTCHQQAAPSNNNNRCEILYERKEMATSQLGNVTPSESQVISHASEKAAGASPTIDSQSSCQQTSSKAINLSCNNNGAANPLPKKKQITSVGPGTSHLAATANKETLHLVQSLDATEGTRAYTKNSDQDKASYKLLRGTDSKERRASHHDSDQATAGSSEVTLPSDKQSSKSTKPVPKKKQILPSSGGSSMHHSTSAILNLAFLEKSVPRKKQIVSSKPSVISANAFSAKPVPRKKQVMSPYVSCSINSVHALLQKPVPRKKQILSYKASLINSSNARPVGGTSAQKHDGTNQGKSKYNTDSMMVQVEPGTETTASNRHEVAVVRVTPEREKIQPQDAAWVEDFHKWLLNTAHGRKNEKVSEENANRIIAKVKLLAMGKGISYVRWRKDVVFYKGKKVDLTSNFDEMLAEAKQFEAKHGEDVGHGWVLRHPITKLGLYKRYLLSQRRSLST